jgi:hypothetical protein
MGACGIAIGMLALAFIKEPKLNTFSKEMTKEQKDE